MKRIPTLAFLLSFFMFAATFLHAQTLVNKAWQDTTGNPQDTTTLSFAEKDGSGYVLVGNTWPTSDSEQLLITKYNSSGTKLWQVHQASVSTKRAISTNLDISNGYVYISSTSYDSTNSKSTFSVAKLVDTTGSTVWQKQYTPTFAGYAVPAAVRADSAGNVYIAGTEQVNDTSYEMTILKYNSSGTVQWTVHYDSAGLYSGAVGMGRVDSKDSVSFPVAGYSGKTFGTWDIVAFEVNITTGSITNIRRVSNGSGSFASHPVALAKDSLGNTYIVGAAEVSGPNVDIKVIKYDSLFNQVWVKTWGGPDSLDDEPAYMVIDNNNNLIITGYTSHATGQIDFLTVKYDQNGNVKWSKTYNNNTKSGTPIAQGASVTLDATNNIYVTGKVYNGNNYDIATLAYDTSGNTIWQQTNDDYNSNDVGMNISLDAQNNVYVSGTTTSSSTTKYITLMYSQISTFLPTDTIDSTGVNAFYQNFGQLYSSNAASSDSVFFYTYSGNPQWFVGDKRISYLFKDNSSGLNLDSVCRVDLTLSGTISSSYSLKNIYFNSPANPYLNYYLGNLPQPINWVPGYDRLAEKSVYTGVDWQLAVTRDGLKTYFVVYPGQKTVSIALQYSGATSISIASHALLITTPYGTLRDTLVAYTIDSVGDRAFISASYDSLGPQKYGVTVGTYNTDDYLVIESQGNEKTISCGNGNLQWSTYFGGILPATNNVLAGLDVDTSGNIFATGQTSGPDFPTTTGLDTFSPAHNAFIAKFSSSNQLVWATCWGTNASGYSFPNPTAIGVANQTVEPNLQPLYIAGSITSFSQTPGHVPLPKGGFIGYYDTTYAGGARDMFLARFDGISGLLTYGTLIGSPNTDQALTLLVNRANNNVFVGGYTGAPSPSEFPFTNTFTGNFYDTSGKAVIIQFDGGMNMLWCTGFATNQLGVDTTDSQPASIFDMQLDNAGDLLIAGQTPAGFSYSVTLPSGAYTQGQKCVTGYSPLSNAFLAKFTPTAVGNQTKYSLYYYSIFGGTDENMGYAITSDNADNIYLGGFTYGVNVHTNGTNQFPYHSSGHSGAYFDTTFLFNDPSDPIRTEYGFVAQFSPSGALQWSTLLGGVGTVNGSSVSYVWKMNTDVNQNLYCFGITGGGYNFPVYDRSGFYFDDDSVSGTQKSFIASFTNQQQRNWVTLYGGNHNTTPGGMRILNDNMYIGGYTQSDQTSTNPFLQFPLYGCGSTYLDSSFVGFDCFLANFNLNGLATSITQPIQSQYHTLSLFPNPNNGNFILDFSGFEGEKQIRIMNILGQTVQSRATTDTQTSFSMNSICPGIYIASVFDNTESASIKFVVSK